MKLVTFASFKGGSGKTTSVMAIASSLTGRGKRVALFDADENEPLHDWHRSALQRKTWSESCQVFATDDLKSLEHAYAEAEREKFDIAIIDTRGGGSELNNACMASANSLVIPSALTTLDMVAALATFEHSVKLLQQMAINIPVALLIQRIPVGKLTVSQKSDLATLLELPTCETMMHTRDAYAAMGKRGMLHKTYNECSQDVMKRFNTAHIATAMREADSLADDITEAMGGL